MIQIHLNHCLKPQELNMEHKICQHRSIKRHLFKKTQRCSVTSQKNICYINLQSIEKKN